MKNLKVDLIGETKSSIEEVVESLLQQKSGTEWAEQTNQFAIDYAHKLTDVYGDVWYKGFLPQKYFLDILLPHHPHAIKGKDDIFPIDTLVKDSINYFETSKAQYTKECFEEIQYLKEEIRKNGFTTSIALVVISGKLKHVDGLHRMIAVAMLLKDGYEYKPIPVFLCDSTKK